MATKDYYQTLGVQKTATPKEIRAAYLSLAKANHPDVGGNSDYFMEVQKAYEILSSSFERASYDFTIKQEQLKKEQEKKQQSGNQRNVSHPYPYPTSTPSSGTKSSDTSSPASAKSPRKTPFPTGNSTPPAPPEQTYDDGVVYEEEGYVTLPMFFKALSPVKAYIFQLVSFSLLAGAALYLGAAPSLVLAAYLWSVAVALPLTALYRSIVTIAAPAVLGVVAAFKDWPLYYLGLALAAFAFIVFRNQIKGYFVKLFRKARSR